MEKEYEYITIENMFSVYKLEHNNAYRSELISRIEAGWEIYKSEIIGTQEYIYKMYILRKEKTQNQQKIQEE